MIWFTLYSTQATIDTEIQVPLLYVLGGVHKGIILQNRVLSPHAQPHVGHDRSALVQQEEDEQEDGVPDS